MNARVLFSHLESFNTSKENFFLLNMTHFKSHEINLCRTDFNLKKIFLLFLTWNVIQNWWNYATKCVYFCDWCKKMWFLSYVRIIFSPSKRCKIFGRKLLKSWVSITSRLVKCVAILFFVKIIKNIKLGQAIGVLLRTLFKIFSFVALSKPFPKKAQNRAWSVTRKCKNMTSKNVKPTSFVLTILCIFLLTIFPLIIDQDQAKTKKKSRWL